MTRPPLKQTPAPAASSKVETRLENGQVTVTIPLTVTVSLGTPVETGSAVTAIPQAPRNIDEAAKQLHREHSTEAIYSVWPAYKIENGKLTDVECLVVSAHPDRVETVRRAVPATFGGLAVEAKELIRDFYDLGGAEDPVHALAQIQAKLARGDSKDWPYFAVFSTEACLPRR